MNPKNIRIQARMRLAANRLAIAVAATVLFAACETTTHGQQGEVLGGVLGGVLGSQVGEGNGRTAAVIVGAIAGAMIGQHIGETMDDTDRMKTASILNDARTGVPTSWVNPDTGYRYAQLSVQQG